MQNLHILRGTLNQNVIFCVQNFFQHPLFKKNFSFKVVLFENVFCLKSCFLKLYFSSKFIEVVKILFQNLTRCKSFVLKTDALEKFNSKSEKF